MLRTHAQRGLETAVTHKPGQERARCISARSLASGMCVMRLVPHDGVQTREIVVAKCAGGNARGKSSDESRLRRIGACRDAEAGDCACACRFCEMLGPHSHSRRAVGLVVLAQRSCRGESALSGRVPLTAAVDLRGESPSLTIAVESDFSVLWVTSFD